MRFVYFFMILLLTGCTSSLTPKPAVKGEFLNEFNTGYAGYAWEFQDNEGKSIWQSSISLLLDDYVNPKIRNVDYDAFEELRESLDDSKFMVMWFTKDWKEYYFNAALIQRAMDRGKIPVFLYWYFGDDFATGDFIKVVDQKRKGYAKMNKKVVDFLNQLNGEVILILEPEFNKQNVLESQETKEVFVKIMRCALTYFELNVSDNINLHLGLSMNDNGSKYKDEAFDCGYEHCALGDKYTWNRSINVFKELSDNLDIVSFSLMLSQFSRGAENPNKPHRYKNEKLGIGYLPQRIANLSNELHTQLDKPVFLSHLVMATGTWSDTNRNEEIEENEINTNGWNREVYETYSKFDYNLFRQNGMFGLALMNLFDDPKHDMGGYNYFLQNEHHLGVLSTGTHAESLQAKDGELKFKTFNEIKLIDLIYKR